MVGSFIAGRSCAVCAFAWRNIGFTADNRLDPGALCFLVEFNSAEHIPVVGDGQGIHFILLGKIKDFRYTAGSVKEAILRVQMKVDKLGMHKLVTA